MQKGNPSELASFEQHLNFLFLSIQLHFESCCLFAKLGIFGNLTLVQKYSLNYPKYRLVFQMILVNRPG